MEGFNTPKQIAAEFCAVGIAKTKIPFLKFAILAWLGGAFIAFGGMLSVVIAGGMSTALTGMPGLLRLMGGAFFPIGLMMVVIAGADLFTSDCAGLTLPLLQRKTSIGDLGRVLITSYVFNFLGAVFVAYFLAYKTGLISSSPWREYLHASSYNRVSLDFLTLFLKGFGANWLVCLAVWMSFAAKDVISKVVVIWVPIMAFVTLGFEHSIANMFFIPAAIFSGADIGWGQFFIRNLLPVTLGNMVAGIFLVAGLYWYVYLKEEDKKS